MRICIPSNTDQGMAATVSQHFGSAPYFTVVDLDSGDLRVLQNPACGHHPSHCHHLSVLRAQNVGAIVCGGIGRRAFAALQEAGIKVLVPTSVNLTDIVAAVREGRAPEMSADAACGGRRHRHSGHCHSDGDGGRHRHHGHCGEDHARKTS